jgi:hypothetical protein
MKKDIKKITLSREILRDLDTKQVFGGDNTKETRTCQTCMTCGIMQGG